MLSHVRPRSPRIALALLLVPLGGACRPPEVPEVALVHVASAARLLGEGRLDDAEASARLALEYHPLLAEAHADLGVVALARGRPDEAELCFRDALRIDPDLAVAEADLGLALERLGRDADARAAFERALAIDPGLVPARRSLIAHLLDHHAFAEARAHALRLLRIEPESATSHALLVVAELGLGRANEASARLDEALVLHPADEALLALRARLDSVRDGISTQFRRLSYLPRSTADE